MPSLPRSFTVHMAFLRTTIIITLALAVRTTHADIYQWQYVNPADPSQGKQPSSTLCPGGAGVNAVPGAALGGLNLTMGYLIGDDLTNANFGGATLTLADLTGAVLTGAEVRGANFSNTNTYDTTDGFKAAQLYSTASYQAGDLTGINFGEDILPGWIFAGKNLTNVSFYYNDLTNADFTGAVVRGTNFYGTANNLFGGFTAAQLYSTASYQAGDLTGIGLGDCNALGGWNFIGKNLTNADFDFASLSGTKFTGTAVRGANFSNTTDYGFTAAQLYSTASYQAGDLTRIDLGENNLSNWNFAGKNLTNANFQHANLNHTDFTGADIRGADARGAHFFAAPPASAVATNLIQYNGHVNGLDLGTSQPLQVVRNFFVNAAQGYDTIPVTIDQHFVLSPGGTLQLVLDGTPWNSRVSFAPGIPVTLGGGTLELSFAPGVIPDSQVGRTFDLFDWTGVTPTGVFSVASPYIWNLSKLYTTGEVTLTSIATVPGDYNGNGVVDAADYAIWRHTLGSTTNLAADGNQNGIIDSGDLEVWKSNFGRTAGSGTGGAAGVPEPTSEILLTIGGTVVGYLIRRRT